MANTRLSMRKIREILRICWGGGLSARQAATSCGVGRTTIKEYLDRAERAGLSWPLPEDLDDAALENRLFPSSIPLEVERRNMPSFDYIRKELTRKHVTLQLLWHEYKEKNPEGYEYSQFCLRFRAWLKTLDVALRQDYKAGEKLFVDFAGDTIPIHDPKTGTVAPAYLFVAALGASNYTYAEAVLSSGPPFLDQSARPYVRILRRRSHDHGPRQPQGRRDPSLPVRAGPQSNVSGHGCPLRHRGRSGKGEETEGQSEGGVRGAHSGEVDHRRPAEPHLLRHRGVQ